MVRFLLLLAVAACAPRVAVRVEGHHAVDLEQPTVAVATHDRACQPSADALVDSLWSHGLEVDPHADLRLHVLTCGDDLQLGIEEVSGLSDTDRRTRALARAHTVVVVTDRHGVRAHLLGSGRHEAHRDGQSMLGWQKQSVNEARRHAANDLVEQLAPGDLTVDRKVWPRAPEGSARELTTQAVLAEQRGDLQEALLWALAAHDQRPTWRTARYLTDLRRRLSSSL